MRPWLAAMRSSHAPSSRPCRPRALVRAVRQPREGRRAMRTSTIATGRGPTEKAPSAWRVRVPPQEPLTPLLTEHRRGRMGAGSPALLRPRRLPQPHSAMSPAPRWGRRSARGRRGRPFQSRLGRQTRPQGRPRGPRAWPQRWTRGLSWDSSRSWAWGLHQAWAPQWALASARKAGGPGAGETRRSGWLLGSGTSRRPMPPHAPARPRRRAGGRGVTRGHPRLRRAAAMRRSDE